MVVDSELCVLVLCPKKLMQAGLRPGDLITHVGKSPVYSSAQFRETICALQDVAPAPPVSVVLTVQRMKLQGSEELSSTEDRLQPPLGTVQSRPSPSDASDRLSWRSMSTNQAPHRAGLPSKCFSEAKLAELKTAPHAIEASSLDQLVNAGAEGAGEDTDTDRVSV